MEEEFNLIEFVAMLIRIVGIIGGWLFLILLTLNK